MFLTDISSLICQVLHVLTQSTFWVMHVTKNLLFTCMGNSVTRCFVLADVFYSTIHTFRFKVSKGLHMGK